MVNRAPAVKCVCTQCGWLGKRKVNRIKYRPCPYCKSNGNWIKVYHG